MSRDASCRGLGALAVPGDWHIPIEGAWASDRAFNPLEVHLSRGRLKVSLQGCCTPRLHPPGQ